ncbi:hypothetical protein PENSPDRAFT_693491 [Peniophora sp. CONT]|nr:hypothetical protein PENSPDRAFT_693491 [Peniophora sp. CONT]
MSSVSESTTEVLNYPITLTLPVVQPSGFVWMPGDVIPTEELEIWRTSKPTVPTLRKRLKDYKERHEGTANRLDLVLRLKAYSEDPDRWSSQFSAVIQGHVGARANSALSQQTEKVFGKKVRQPLTFKSTSNTVQDVRRPQDIAAATTKALEYLEKRRVRDIASQTILGGGSSSSSLQLGVPDQPVADPIPTAPNDAVRHILAQQRMLQQQLSELQTSLTQLNLQQAQSAAPIRPVSTQSSSASHTLLATSSAHGSHQPLPFSSIANVMPVTPAASGNASENGVPAAMSISEAQLPVNFISVSLDESSSPIRIPATHPKLVKPPRRSFTTLAHYKDLFRLWYSTDPNDCMLEVDGHVLPIRVWDQCYKGVAWESFKSMWHKWKRLVEAYEDRGSDIDTFVRDFTENGQLMNLTKIQQTLTNQRSIRDTNDTANARKLFGADLATAAGHFLYTKGSIQKVMTDTTSIARRWRELLKDNVAVRQEWERMKAGEQLEQ